MMCPVSADRTCLGGDSCESARASTDPKLTGRKTFLVAARKKTRYRPPQDRVPRTHLASERLCLLPRDRRRLGRDRVQRGSTIQGRVEQRDQAPYAAANLQFDRWRNWPHFRLAVLLFWFFFLKESPHPYRPADRSHRA